MDLDAYILVCELGEGSGGFGDFSKGHFGPISAVVSGKTGRFIISAGHDGRLHTWI